MRYNIYINALKCKEWELNARQGAMFDLLNQVSSWATETIINKKVYYHISRNKVIEEIPLFYEKPDTVYRHFKALHEKGLIIYLKKGVKDLVRLTEKGKGWNSEPNPSKLGTQSESNSDTNPTYNDTNTNNVNNIIKEENFLIKHLKEKHSRKFKLAYDSKLKQRLKTYSKEEILKAVDNCYSSDFVKSRGYGFASIEYFTRNDSNIEKWLHNEDAPKKEEHKEPIFKMK